MLRLPVSCLVPALLAASPLAAQAQTPADSVVRTTTVTTITTTTVTKPASAAGKTAPATSSSSSTTTTTSTAPPTPAPAANSASAPATAPARSAGSSSGDLTGARPRATSAPAAASTTATTTKATTTKATPTTKSKTAAPAASRAAATSAPTTSRATTPAPAQARRTTPIDPELAHLLQTDVDPTKVTADQLPNLYERFLETTRAERRQWTSAQWASASAALSRLNQRYEQVRGDLTLEDKLNIRTLQGEFRTLEAAKQVSKRL